MKIEYYGERRAIMRIKIYPTSIMKNAYFPILESYNLEIIENTKFDTDYYITINNLEDIMNIFKEIRKIDNSELIITDFTGNIELEIYNAWRE
jgi:hypothetical protein